MKIKIKTHANSSQEKIIKKNNNEYEIWIKEKPIEGKANIHLIKILKKYFKSKNINIISGFNSRNKFIEIIN